MSGDHNEPPPEPGFARREGSQTQKPPEVRTRRTAPETEASTSAGKEGAHGGTRGSHVKASEAKRKTKRPAEAGLLFSNAARNLDPHEWGRWVLAYRPSQMATYPSFGCS
jgi:hypothetical protein